MKNPISLNGLVFEPYILEETIDARITEIAEAINKDFKDKDPLFLVVLNGAFMFASDLLKKITIPCTVSFVKLASYSGTSSTGTVKTLIGVSEQLIDRHIIVLEDIIDTGKTMQDVYNQINQQAASVTIASLLYKIEEVIYPTDVAYAAFEVPSYFYLGYGLDYDGHGRNLPCIYKQTEELT